MKACEKCKELTAILLEEYPEEAPPLWVCPTCYALDQGEEEFERALDQAGIYMERVTIQ